MNDLTGLQAQRDFDVTDADTAAALGSGTVGVLGTPRLLAWLEAATVSALDGRLGDGETSVGTRVDLKHRKPSAVGSTVRCAAEVTGHDGRKLEFRATAHADDGTLLAEAAIHRAIVDESAFA
ncbi:putative thioesterase [Pseudonocardia sediminis]|uniref:Putative thioesterase n=1 Tax=Pseudonocardia sediminis TaxID=1397368 RepID=A0A4Q7UXK6_PSEST|nr:hotdog domain-containing protein [Pseudonocardia sediminis]RZT85834.1 putative thioesterase [Pseudonocardia sediminis]